MLWVKLETIDLNRSIWVRYNIFNQIWANEKSFNQTWAKAKNI